MTSPQMARLDEHLQRLRLNTVRERVEALLQEASEKELSYADFLDGLLSEEVSAKTAKHVTMRTNLARFPFIKGLDPPCWGGPGAGVPTSASVPVEECRVGRRHGG